MAKNEDLSEKVKDILDKYNVPLKEFMQAVLPKIAGYFQEKGLVTPSTVDQMGLTGVVQFNLAADLLAACRPALVCYPEENFPEFIAVLKKFKTMKKLAKEIEEEFKQATSVTLQASKGKIDNSDEEEFAGRDTRTKSMTKRPRERPEESSDGSTATSPSSPLSAEKDSHGKAPGMLERWANFGVLGVLLPILVVLLAIVVGGVVWFVQTPPETLSPSSSDALTCEWPLPNSAPVKSQVMQIKTELGVEDILDNLKTIAERVKKALIAGDKCKDAELRDKMNLVGTTVRKIKEKLQGIYGGFDTSAETALTDLKSVWKFAVQGERNEAVQRMKSVCDSTKSLEKQLDSLKGYIDTKASELRQALEALSRYQEKTKDNHESRQHKLREEKQRYEEKFNADATLASEAEQKAHGAATQAQKEMEALEEEKANKDAFGSSDQNPFEKRRARFLKDQLTFEAEAEDSKRRMEQIRVEITRIGKDNETANNAFKCISDAITKMKEAVGSVSMPIVSVSLLESLKTECTDLHHDIKSIDSLGDPKGPSPSQVCGKAKELFAKWQALLKVSLDYFSSEDVEN